MSREIAIGVAKSHYSDVKALRQNWGDLVVVLNDAKQGVKEGSGWVAAEISNGPRKLEHIKSISLIVFDIDNKGAVLRQNEIMELINTAGYRAILHSTYNHTPESPRYRLILDISEPIKPKHHKNILLYIAQKLGISNYIDKACLDAARFFYRPRSSKEQCSTFEFWSTDGDPVNVQDCLNQISYRNDAVPASTSAHTQVLGWEENDRNIAKVREFLSFCPADYEYNQWRNIVWSICSLKWDIGPQLIVEWSRRSKSAWGDS
jgi:hypothetical protein